MISGADPARMDPKARWQRCAATARAAVIALSCLGLAVPAGCVRTSDGSVELAAPPSLPKLPSLAEVTAPFGFRRAANRNEYPAAPPEPAAVAAPAQPAAVTAPVKSKPRIGGVRVWRPSVKPPMAKASGKKPAPAKPLACRNEPGAGGRIKVVCA